jgi:hypothetical protein
MSISIGGINIADSVLNLEFRLGVLERIIDTLGQRGQLGSLNQAEIEAIREQVLADLQKRYPDAGITKK